MPSLDVIAMLAAMLGGSALFAWIMHLMIGTLAWGAGFALLHDTIPGNGTLTKGIVFDALAWLGMMVLVMPAAGAGLFGSHLGIMAPIMTLMLHLVFGAVLRGVYRLGAEPAHVQSR